MSLRISPSAAVSFAQRIQLLWQAFKSYDEAGAVRRIQCLKYLVLATMLMESAVDPFDAQEAAPYKQDPEVLAMTNLVAAYQQNDIMGFERILKTNKCAPGPHGSNEREPSLPWSFTRRACAKSSLL